METPGGIYSLNDPDAARKNLRSAMELYTPVKGVVTEKFSPIDNRYGTTLATAGNQQVMAVMDGTVVCRHGRPKTASCCSSSTEAICYRFTGITPAY